MTRASNRTTAIGIAKATMSEYTKLAGRMQVAVDDFTVELLSGDPVNDPGPQAWQGVVVGGRNYATYQDAVDRLDYLRRQARHYAGIAAKLSHDH